MILLTIFLILFNNGTNAFGIIKDEKPSYTDSQKDFINKIKGNWKLNTYGSNWGYVHMEKLDFEELMVIGDTAINFYRKQNLVDRKELIETQKIKFTENSTSEDNMHIVFSDRKHWKVTYKIDGSLTLINTQYTDENGLEYELLCGMSEKSYTRVK